MKNTFLLNEKIYADVEIFKYISYPGIRENFYMISNFGTIIYAKTGNIRHTRIDKDGYIMIGLMGTNGKQNQYRVHRLVAWEFCPNRDIELVVNHIDNKPSNNYYKNLEWVSIAYNTIHGHDFGNGKHGESHYKNKYSIEIILEICSLLETKMSQGQIYSIINTKFLHDIYPREKIIRLIKDIKRRKVWRSVAKDYKF